MSATLPHVCSPSSVQSSGYMFAMHMLGYSMSTERATYCSGLHLLPAMLTEAASQRTERTKRLPKRICLCGCSELL